MEYEEKLVRIVIENENHPYGLRINSSAKEVVLMDSQQDSCIMTLRSKTSEMSVNFCTILGECRCEGDNCS